MRDSYSHGFAGLGRIPPPSRRRGARHDPDVAPVTPPWPVYEDLHLHSTASDGTATPTQLIEFVAATPLRIVALTDHDTTSGLAEASAAAAQFPQLTLIPGVELSVAHGDSEIHLTCHYIDPGNAELQAALTRIVTDRASRAQAMVSRLRDVGIELDWDAIIGATGNAIGRPHIGRAIVSAGHAATLPEAFARFLNPGQHAYVPRAKFDIFEALDIVHRAGGVATVAHPRTARDLHTFIGDLADAGLAGIEVYAEKYDAAQIAYYAQLADTHGLVKSGGTDYHANGNANETLPGMNGPPQGTAHQLQKRINRDAQD